MRDTETLSPEWNVSIRPLPLGSGTPAEEGGGKIVKGQWGWRTQGHKISRLHRTDAYECTETLAACTGLHRSEPAGVLAVRGKVNTNPQP